MVRNETNHGQMLWRLHPHLCLSHRRKLSCFADQQRLSFNKSTDRAGRFLWDAVTLYSFSLALHSVLMSSDRPKRFNNACSAEWIASAASIFLSRIRSRSDVGRSIQKPVVSLSQVGVSRSTVSRILWFLRDIRYRNMYSCFRLLTWLWKNLSIEFSGSTSSVNENKPKTLTCTSISIDEAHESWIWQIRWINTHYHNRFDETNV